MATLNAKLEPFKLRNQALPILRSFFASLGLEEASSDLFLTTTAIEPYIEPIYVGNQVLCTSPEFALKKMMALYNENIGLYEIAKVARADQRSLLHSNSFTMVEWYHRDLEYLQLVDHVMAMIKTLSGIDFNLRFISIQQLYQEQLGLNLESGDEVAWCKLDHGPKRGQSLAERQLTLIDAFSLSFDQYIQPYLSKQKDVIAVYDFPPFMRGMAELNPEGWAKKVEIIFRGVELANGYQELANPSELKNLWSLNNEIRLLKNKKAHTIDETLLHLTPQMQGVAGMAMGLERLLMVLFDIKEIVAFKLP